MKLYILTQNQYMFMGLKHLLCFYLDRECIQLDPKDETNIDIYRSSSASDIFFVIPDGEYLDLLSLIHLQHSHSPVLIANNDIAWKVSAVFDFSPLPQKFMLGDILHGLCFLKIKKKLIQFPRMTEREKKVLLLVKKGYAIPRISSLMNIKRKTALHHQLNALKKVGIKKTHHIVKLPKNYIRYLCGPVDTTA